MGGNGGRARDKEDDYINTEEALNGGDTANATDWTENENDLMPEDMEPRVPEKSKEDLEFEQMYEKMASDCYQERLKESVKPNTKDIPVPMMARTKKSYDQLSSSNAASTSANADASKTQPDGAIPFVLMVRGGKGGKQQFKQFVAPSDSHLVINLKMQEEKIREEKEKVKRLTLDITERIEEEDYQESLMQSQRNLSQSHYQRPSKPKFRHQKGAPDVDLIFN